MFFENEEVTHTVSLFDYFLILASIIVFVSKNIFILILNSNTLTSSVPIHLKRYVGVLDFPSTSMHVHLVPYHTHIAKVSVLDKVNGSQGVKAEVDCTPSPQHICWPTTGAHLYVSCCTQLEQQVYGPN